MVVVPRYQDYEGVEFTGVRPRPRARWPPTLARSWPSALCARMGRCAVL